MIVDSSYLVALYHDADVLHSKAVDVYQLIGTFYLLEPLLFETITVLSMKADKTVVCSVLQFLCDSNRFKFVKYNDFMRDRAIDLFLTQKGSLSLYDMILVVASKEYKMPVLSFDKKLLSFCDRFKG